MTTHSGPLVGQRDRLRAISCEACGFIHLDPIPDNERWYTGGGYHRKIKPDYRREYDEDAEWWNAVYGDWEYLLYEHLSHNALFLGNRIVLDVGAGTGHFVHYLRRDGIFWDAVGIEADKDMADRSEYIVHSSYNEYRTRMHLWCSVISAHWVLEHLPDPAHFLQWSRERLVDGGLLLLTIPNDFSAKQMYLYDVGWLNGSITPYYWLNAMHINYWEKHSFTRLLKNNGYEVLSIYGSWEPEEYLLGGQNYLSDHTLGRWLHRNRMLDDLGMSREERLAKYLKLGEQGRGRDLTFLCRKA